MIDLFGMGRQEPQDPQEPDAAAAPETAEETLAPRGSHRLWAFLLVLDSIFVIVFGGAVAAKIYQYWKAPAAIAAPARPHPRAKAAEAAKAPEPAPAPAPAAAPAKPVEPPKAAPEKPAPKPETARHSDAPRAPKPSLLNEAPKPHAAPAPAVAAAPAAPGRALPVIFKIRAPHAGAVQLVGAFIVHGGRKEMTKDGSGVWTLKLYLNPGQYRYFFAVDRKKTLDPENPRSDRGASVLSVP